MRVPKKGAIKSRIINNINQILKWRTAVPIYMAELHKKKVTEDLEITKDIYRKNKNEKITKEDYSR